MQVAGFLPLKMIIKGVEMKSLLAGATLLLAFLASDFAVAGDVSQIFAEQEVQACSVRAQASWNGCSPGSDSQRCTYNPPPGWTISSHRIQVRSQSNGSHGVDTLAANLDFMSEEELQEAYRSAIDYAGNVNNDAAAARLNEQYAYHLRDLRHYRTTHNTLVARASARAHGSCWDRKRGWSDIVVFATLKSLGPPDQQGLARVLKAAVDGEAALPPMPAE